MLGGCAATVALDRVVRRTAIYRSGRYMPGSRRCWRSVRDLAIMGLLSTLGAAIKGAATLVPGIALCSTFCHMQAFGVGKSQ